MTYANPQLLIDATTLNEQLDDPGLRIFDAAVFLTPQRQGGYAVTSGREKYSEGHIPGAGFVDLTSDWADTSGGLNFTLPVIDQLAAAIGNSGIGNANRVVLYSSGHLMWATRAWWLLHYAGHEHAAVLNGNLGAWQAAGLPLAQGEAAYPVTTFEPRADAARFADTAAVEAGMHGEVCTINALTQALYEGTGDFYYQRRGHIPGSKLMYYDDVLRDEFFLPAEELGPLLEAQGMLSADRVITYCGGGIAATLDAFACKLMGQDNVAVYDGSLSEWVQDPERPLTTGSAP